MTYNAFGGFTTSSPISSIPHNSCHDLASNCIRDYFGPTVQTVFDYLLSKSGGCVNLIMYLFRDQLLQHNTPRCYRSYQESGKNVNVMSIHVDPCRSMSIISMQPQNNPTGATGMKNTSTRVL